MSGPSMSLEDEFVTKVSGFWGKLRSCCLKKNKDIYAPLISEQWLLGRSWLEQKHLFDMATYTCVFSDMKAKVKPTYLQLHPFINWSRNNLINPKPDISLSLKSNQKI